MGYTKGEWNCTCEAGYSGNVIHCPLHASAPDMYEALKLWTAHNQGTKGHYCSVCAEAMGKALAKAEGK